MVTHIGDGCRAAGFLPIAMPPSLRHSVDLRSTPIISTFAQLKPLAVSAQPLAAVVSISISTHVGRPTATGRLVAPLAIRRRRR